MLSMVGLARQITRKSQPFGEKYDKIGLERRFFMQTFSYPAKELPFDDAYDVIVCGGGPAGVAAAMAAARSGASTLLIESANALGGMATRGMVPTWCPYSDGEKVVYRGIAKEIFDASTAALEVPPRHPLNWVGIDPEALKVILDEKVTEAGVKVLFGTLIVDAASADGTVKAVICANKAGLSAYGAKVFVDCTGDADLVVYAHGETVKGDGNGHLQAATHCFELTNVDVKTYLASPSLHGSNAQSPIHKVLADGKYPLITDHHICQTAIRPDTVAFNAGHLWGVDPNDPAGVSKALMDGRRKAFAFRDALREYVPESFGHADVGATAETTGIRESRRIVADYELTKDDYVARRSFPDEIGRNCYYLDIHMSPEEVKATGHQSLRYGKGESHGIPYRSLCPKTLVNVLAAGRSIGTDRAVQGSTRVMPVCFVTGEAAGTAAAMAAKSASNDVHAVDADVLRETLRENGAYFL